MRAAIVIVLGLALAVSRPLLPAIPLDNSPMSLYKDFGHIIVGIMLGGAILASEKKTRLVCLFLFLLLAIVEGVVFVMKTRELWR